MKWIYLIDINDITQQNGRFRGPRSYFLTSLSLFSFRFISLTAEASIEYLFNGAKISKSVLSDMMLILRRRQSVLNRR